MSGMLPGVEAARRRRTHHQSAAPASSSNLTRRPAYCLYATSFDPNPISSSSTERGGTITTCQDDKLGQLARKAKERLDERLRAQRKSLSKFNSTDPSDERWAVNTEVFGSKKKLMRWANKLVGWKASEQEECAVCLEQFKVGENLVNLPCAHRFHSRCVIPWIQANSHCPCCRFLILPA